MSDLQTAFHRKKSAFYPSRQRFTLPQKAGEKRATALAPGKRLSDYGLEDGSIVIFKDLGPQVLSMEEAGGTELLSAMSQDGPSQTRGLRCRSATPWCSSGSTSGPWSSTRSSTSSRTSSIPLTRAHAASYMPCPTAPPLPQPRACASTDRPASAMLLDSTWLQPSLTCASLTAARWTACMHLLRRRIPPKHPVQTMALAYWSFHYSKRILETFFVHRCSC